MAAGEECAAGLNIGIVVGAVVAALVLGFLIGTRAKQIIAAVQKSAKAFISLKELLKAGEAADKADDGGEDNEPVDEGENDEDERGAEALAKSRAVGAEAEDCAL